MNVKEIIKPYVYSIVHFKARRALKNKKFTIICDNCWAGKVYQELGLPYQTPFIGLFVFSPDYIKLVKNIRYYLSGDIELTFISVSKWLGGATADYPIALLDDIELHFLHYASEEEAYEKWTRRLHRIDWGNVFFKFNDNDRCNYDLLKEFSDLPYQGRVIFSAKNYSDLDTLIHFKSRERQECVGTDLKYYHRYFDVIKWLNSGGTNFNDELFE